MCLAQKCRGKNFFSEVESQGVSVLWPKPHIQSREYPLVLCKASLLGRLPARVLWAELADPAESRETNPAPLRALLADIYGGFSTLDHDLHLKLLSPSLSGLAAADWEMQVEIVSSSLAERVWHKASHPELHLCCPFLGQTAAPGLTMRISNLPAEKNV